MANQTSHQWIDVSDSIHSPTSGTAMSGSRGTVSATRLSMAASSVNTLKASASPRRDWLRTLTRLWRPAGEFLLPGLEGKHASGKESELCRELFRNTREHPGHIEA